MLTTISSKNLQILSECNSSISVKFVHEDPLVAGKQYGVVRSMGVKASDSALSDRKFLNVHCCCSGGLEGNCQRL